MHLGCIWLGKRTTDCLNQSRAEAKADLVSHAPLVILCIRNVLFFVFCPAVNVFIHIMIQFCTEKLQIIWKSHPFFFTFQLNENMNIYWIFTHHTTVALFTRQKKIFGSEKAGNPVDNIKCRVPDLCPSHVLGVYYLYHRSIVDHVSYHFSVTAYLNRPSVCGNH